MFSRFFKKKEEPIQFEDKSLYILIEAPKSGIVSYLEANGVHVKAVLTDIGATVLALIKDRNPLRLVIVDLGLGTWKNLDSINNIVGLVSQCSDTNRDATVFTKNGKLSKELRDTGAEVDIREYKGISDIIRALMEYPENYITPGAIDFDGEPLDSLQNYKYKRKDLENKVKDNMGEAPTFTDVTVVNMQDGESLEGFKCKF